MWLTAIFCELFRVSKNKFDWRQLEGEKGRRYLKEEKVMMSFISCTLSDSDRFTARFSKKNDLPTLSERARCLRHLKIGLDSRWWDRVGWLEYGPATWMFCFDGPLVGIWKSLRLSADFSSAWETYVSFCFILIADHRKRREKRSFALFLVSFNRESPGKLKHNENRHQPVRIVHPGNFLDQKLTGSCINLDIDIKRRPPHRRGIS